MPAAAATITEAVFITAPRNPNVRALYEHWQALRGRNSIPPSAAFDAHRLPTLLPFIVMYDVVGGTDRYTVRLIGEEVARFIGSGSTGRSVGIIVPRRAAETMIRILDTVVAHRTAFFRAGKAYWGERQNERAFESCFLPLSTFRETVDVILCAITFGP
jgi:hypothetical protein